MQKKFEAKCARVKGLSFHPSRPWVIVSLHSSQIQIWDYNMKIMISKFKEHEGPVRGISFHNTLPLFVSGGDDGNVKVWNYKQKRCLFTLKGHIDYVRTTFFHHQLPWILSSCDDQTMRIWNYQSRSCVNVITGHSHYVMCAQFHPQRNFIVSCSLDSTIRLWDFTVLRKKLTESKNTNGYIGIQIECIKILEGHQRGVNWVCFHPSQNIIASSSDDRKIKLWKYTNEIAWQHSTIEGHSSNVSSVLFDPKTGNLISNSEDKTVRVWNPESKVQLKMEKRENQRYWILAAKKNGNLLGCGHDEGFDVFLLNKQKIPHVIIEQSLVIFAQGMKTFLFDAEKKVQKEELYQYSPKDKNTVAFIQRLIINPFNSSTFIVQINQNNSRTFMIKKKQNYLNFPFVVRTYDAMDSCFISKTHIAVLSSPQEIQFINYQSKDQKTKGVLKLKDNMKILRVFNSHIENVLIFVTQNFIAKYDTKKNQMIGQQELQPNVQIKNVNIDKGKIAVGGKYKVIITDSDLNHITTIEQKFPIQSTFWQSQNILFYTTTNHWKYCLMNGQSGVLRSIDEPLHLLKKLPNFKFLAFSETNKIFEIDYQQFNEIQFKLAIIEKDWDRVKKILKQLGGCSSNNKSMISYLVKKGYSQIALDLVQNPEEKFSLALQSSNFKLAFQICNKINTPQYWKTLQQQSLKQGIYQAYEISCQKQKSYDKLNFLWSLQANTEKLDKLLKLSKKIHDPMIAFNTALFLNNTEEKENILRETGLEKLAELSAEAASNDKSELLKRLGSKPLNLVRTEGDPDFSNWPHTVVEEEDQY